MFEGVLHRAQRAVDAVLAKFLGRAAVAVPLLIALGFGTAALTVKLTELYGAVASYLVMAILFAAVGGLIAMIVSSTTEVEATSAASEEPQAAASAPLLDKDLLFNKDMLLTALTTAGPIALPRLVGIIARNLPLVVMAMLIGIFFLARSSASGVEPAAGEAAAERQAPPAA